METIITATFDAEIVNIELQAGTLVNTQIS